MTYDPEQPTERRVPVPFTAYDRDGRVIGRATWHVPPDAQPRAFSFRIKEGNNGTEA